MEDLRSFAVHPDRLEFVSCPWVEHVSILMQGKFVDYHQHFKGFREGGNLKPSDTFTSLHDLGNEMNIQVQQNIKLQKQANMGSFAKTIPRRIRGLSARRDPLQAV